MEDALPVIHVLFAQRSIESVSMAGRVDVGRWSAFPEHGLNGIAGNQMDQEEDARHDQPDDRERVEQAD